MNKRTKRDYRTLYQKNESIRLLNEEIDFIKDNCPCHDFRPDIQRTLAFEHTPVGICVVCGKHREEPLTIKEKTFALTKEFGDLYSEEQIKFWAKAGGFNS